MTDTTDAAALAGMVENALRMAMTTITGQDDDWEEIAMAQIEAGIDHAAALDAARIAAEQRAAAERGRAERLREAIISEHEKWEAWVTEITGQQGKVNTSRAGTIALIRRSQRHLHDGDLDAAPAPARAEGGDA